MMCIAYNGYGAPCFYPGSADDLSFVWRGRPTACVWIIPGTINDEDR